ncbi:hypothetical protein O4G73_08860 [Erythrobacter sp. G21629-S1]|jgi:hypothetical protein|nr:hypothetical protein [Erythrobacter sp. G21629-S1]|tara:strand:+ start:141 stop:506 length:366 start_codon:yes stop_codon:yes gene_type:complete
MLELRSIADRGNFAKERITLRVIADADVGDFLLLQTNMVGEDLSTQVRHAFWFPYQRVSRGDLVVVYTKYGIPSSKPLKVKGNAHFFFFDLSESIWGNQNRGAVLLHAPSWEWKRSKDLWK